MVIFNFRAADVMAVRLQAYPEVGARTTAVETCQILEQIIPNMLYSYHFTNSNVFCLGLVINKYIQLELELVDLKLIILSTDTGNV